MFEYTDVIKSRINMIDICKTYGFNIQRGNFICCPFHNEKTPSLKLYDGNRGFYCFGCGDHGSIIDFVMRYFGLDFQSAISKLNDDFCLGFPIGQRVSLRQRYEMQQRQEAIQAEKERQQAEFDRLTAEYWAAFDLWQKYDTNKREYAPKSPSEDFHPLYVEAVKNIDCAAYLLDTAEMRLRDYADKRHNNSQH